MTRRYPKREAKLILQRPRTLYRIALESVRSVEEGTKDPVTTWEFVSHSLDELVKGHDFNRIKALGRDLGRPEFERGAQQIETALIDFSGQLLRSAKALSSETGDKTAEMSAVAAVSRKASEAFAGLGHSLMKYTHFESQGSTPKLESWSIDQVR